MVTTVPRSKGGQNLPPCSRHVSPSFRPMQIKTAALVKHRTTCLLNVFAHPPRQIDSPPLSSTAYYTICQTPGAITAPRFAAIHGRARDCESRFRRRCVDRCDCANSRSPGHSADPKPSLECLNERFSFYDPKNSCCRKPRGIGCRACARGLRNRRDRPVGRRCTEGASRFDENGTRRCQTRNAADASRKTGGRCRRW